mmetsp:Transcript_53583/g.149030  ORF Transcript_53583/g.149030 Transcript_53583/m.149030 type:complete len:809 (-) Transcript_53583:67-2493(-)
MPSRPSWCRVAFVLAWPTLVAGWNSAVTLDAFYSFQEFYTDAQYGPDFGYYSTGRILHEKDSSSDVGGQEWFNSYTTLPMSLSPFFGQLICERLASMWHAMDRPGPVFVVEFGGGTGVLARDVLRHCRKDFPKFYEALGRYYIGERSEALRGAQRHTAAEFEASGKLRIVEADARRASRLRGLLETEAGGTHVRGFVLSNEVLDEFDPVRLRLVWPVGSPPTALQCAACSAFRESYVLHRLDEAALVALLRRTLVARSRDGDAGDDAAPTWRRLESIRWEGMTEPCGLLGTPALQRLIVELVQRLSPSELGRCMPLQICCGPLLLATDSLAQRSHPQLQQPRPYWKPAVVDDVLSEYRRQLDSTNGTVFLTKRRYRELRRLATELGPEVERSLLVGGPALPGHVHSHEVFLALSAARCEELSGWRERNADRLAAASRLRGAVAPLYDRLGQQRGGEHLKLVVRPGEAEFAREAGALVDEGFMVTLDYGADAEALLWQSLVHPNFEGIHTMDARAETAKECTQASYLACPGLQDVTTTVDFTEFAEAGRRLGGWETRAYGPVFLLELAFDPWLDTPLAHLIERGGGARTVGLHSWYKKAEGEQWASFKLLVQHRGKRGREWSLGAEELRWPLQGSPQLGRVVSPCWNVDVTKPPFASLVVGGAQAFLGGDSGMESSDALRDAFLAVLESPRGWPAEEEARDRMLMQAFRDLHLAFMLSDYWLHLARGAGSQRCADPDPSTRREWAQGVRSLAAARRLPELHGDEMFERVLAALEAAAFGKPAEPGPGVDPFVCMAAQLIRSGCSRAAEF